MPFTSTLLHISLRDIIFVLFRHKWKIFFVFVFLFSAVTAATYLMTKVYRSEAKLLIRLGRENLSVDPSISGPTVNLNQSRESEVNSEMAILTSRYLAEQLVNQMGDDTILGIDRENGVQQKQSPDTGPAAKIKGALKSFLTTAEIVPDLEPHERAIKEVLSNLSVEVEKYTNIINLTYDAPEPDTARAIMQNLMDLYLERHIEVYAAQASPDFFESQTQKVRKTLEEREEVLAEFRRQHGIVSMDRQQEILLQQISDLENQLEEAVSAIGGGTARVAALEKTLAGRDVIHELSRTTGRTNYAADDLKERLMTLRLQESDLAARYPDGYRPLLEVRDQIKQVETALAQEDPTLTEITTGLDTNYQQLALSLETERAQLEADRARYEKLQNALQTQQNALNQLAAREVELERLTRDMQLAEQEYSEYRNNLQRANISAALDVDQVSNVSIVQPATLPLEPVKPNKPLNLALGMFLGLFGGVTIAFLLQYLDDSLQTEEDVERRLGIPVLTVISDKEFKACI